MVEGKAERRARLKAFDALLELPSDGDTKMLWLPEMIMVGPVPFKIVIDHDLSRLGECDFDAQTISLNPSNQGPIRMAETLVHEVMHAIHHAAGFREQIRVPEEEYVRRVEGLWLGVLRTNPDLVMYLMAWRA